MTPKAIACRALVIVAIYAVLNAFGLRDYASVLTSTEPTASGAMLLPMIGVATYLLFYILAWILAPILLLTAGLLALWNRVRGSATAS
jgi:uncharacterized membrane protein